MKIEKITIGVGVTKNMGNYQSLRIYNEITSDISEHEDKKIAIEILRAGVAKLVEEGVADGVKNWATLVKGGK